MAGENVGGLAQRLEMRIVGLGPAEFRQARPVTPRQIGNLLLALHVAQRVERLGRAFGQSVIVGVTREQIADCDLDCGVEARLRLPGKRLGRNRREAFDRASGEIAELAGRHVVGAGAGDDIIDVLAPVVMLLPFVMAKPAAEIVKLGCVARYGSVRRLAENLDLRLVADDLSDRRKAEP